MTKPISGKNAKLTIGGHTLNVQSWMTMGDNAMTEQDWLLSNDPAAMLSWLEGRDWADTSHDWDRRITDRQLTAWVEACREACDALNKYQLGQWQAIGALTGSVDAHVESWATDRDLKLPLPTRAALLRDVVGSPWRPVQRLGRQLRDGLVEVLRESDGCIIVADRDRVPVRFPRPDGTFEIGVTLEPSPLLTWNDATIPKMAQAIKDEKDYAPVRFLLLADALEEAGCTNAAILEHCRGTEKAKCPRCDGVGCYNELGPNTFSIMCRKCDEEGYLPVAVQHCAGCWVLNLLLDDGH